MWWLFSQTFISEHFKHPMKKKETQFQDFCYTCIPRHNFLFWVRRQQRGHQHNRPPTPKKCDSNSIVQIEDKRQSVWKNRQSVCFTQNVLHLWLLAVIGLGTYMCVCLSRADCHAPQYLLGNLRKPSDTTNNVSREIRSWCVLQK